MAAPRLPDVLSDELPGPIFRRTVDLLVELTAISSPSGDADGLRRISEKLGAELTQRGFSATTEEATGETGTHLPLLLARGAASAAPAGGPIVGTLLVIGHLDTVLPAAPPRLASDRLIATGAVDMKGGLAAFLGALDLLRHRGIEAPPGLLLAVVPDEEVGGVASRRAVRRFGEEARAFWVLEPGEPAAGGGETLVAGRRGMFNWRLEAHGRAAHSGLHYWQGRSALIAAAGWCCEAEAHSKRDGGPTVNVGRLVAGDALFVDALAENAALLRTDRQLNVVPDLAVAEGEVRFLRREDGARMAETLAALARNVGQDTETRLSLAIGETIPPVDPDGPHAAWAGRAVALAATRGWRLDLERERGGISFPNFLPDPTRLPVLDGLGPVGGGMHTREEFVDLTSLGRRIVLLADLLASEEV